MKLSEVLIDVDTMIINDIAPTTKIGWLNQLRRRMYRELPIDESVYAFETVAGESLIQLPDDCPHDAITSVTIGFRPYRKVNQSDRNTPAYFWTVVAGGFLISPVPTQAEAGFVYYKATPPDLTVADLDEELDFSSDYHEGLFVAGCLVRTAKATGDFKTAEIYDIELQETIRKMKRDMDWNNIYTIQVGEW